jgi:hypothetical protein
MQFDELCGRGNFEREDIVTALTVNEGDQELAFQELNKMQLRPFLMRIWGQGEQMGEVTSGNTEIKQTDVAAENAEPAYQPGELLKNIAIPDKAEDAATAVAPEEEKHEPVVEEEREEENPVQKALEVRSPSRKPRFWIMTNIFTETGQEISGGGKSKLFCKGRNGSGTDNSLL